jgi:hypothetical protein
MYRRSLILTIGVALAISAGCCQPCGSRTGWFTSNSNCNTSNQPYKLVGNTKPMGEGCYDAVTGVPVPCPPPGNAMVIPGGGYPVGPMPQPMVQPSNELPYPNPNNLIPPSAIPTPAPGFGASVNPNFGQPVKIVPNK